MRNEMAPGDQTRNRVSDGMTSANGDSFLSVKDLHVQFFTFAGVVKSLNGFDLSVGKGEMSALVGESGSGKSVLAWSMLGIINTPGKIVRGEVLWRGHNVLQMSPARLRQVRGKEISLILSNPRSHLHPLWDVGSQIVAVHRAHHNVSEQEAREAVLETMKSVGLADPMRVFRSYPHELSGGMAQRILIATALINSPEMVIADDATNGLDVTVQRQVLDLMARLIRERNASALMITHDLGIVAQYCKRATIIYAGQAYEVADTALLFENPLHPYTQSILGSIRSAYSTIQARPLPGITPNLMNLPRGCYLAPRCPVAMPECREQSPELRQVEPGHWVRCLRYGESGNAGQGTSDQTGARISGKSV